MSSGSLEEISFTWVVRTARLRYQDNGGINKQPSPVSPQLHSPDYIFTLPTLNIHCDECVHWYDMAKVDVFVFNKMTFWVSLVYIILWSFYNLLNNLKNKRLMEALKLSPAEPVAIYWLFYGTAAYGSSEILLKKRLSGLSEVSLKYGHEESCFRIFSLGYPRDIAIPLTFDTLWVSNLIKTAS